MDEQQSTFKVTDRRLFNADGSPREVPEEERPKPEAAKPASPPAVEQTAESQASNSVGEAEPDRDVDEELSEEDVAAARDPASFLNFLMSLASNAASALGMMEHPVTHQRDVDLELGKHWIDVLGMLQKKTQGNLSSQEKQMLESLLADLRMQYVSLTGAPKTRNFSARDITGGR